MRSNQDFIRHNPMVRHAGYPKTEKNADIQNIHTYIVEWQIPVEVEPNTRA